MIGILTEKPSAGRNFAKALGGSSGTYNGEQFTIVSARGHCYEYADPAEMVPESLKDQYKSWDTKYLPWNERDFSWRREIGGTSNYNRAKRMKKGVTAAKQYVDGYKATLKGISSVLSGCDEVVIATDVDPTGEGELLAWEILDELNIRNKKFSRMYFTDESAKEIQKAFVGRKPIASMETDMDYVKALYRSKWDLLSMQFTRIATECVGGAVIRQGRLKSVMVKIVGDALMALKNYVRKPFYSNKFKDENGVIYSNPDEPRFENKNEVPNSYHPSAVVVDSVERKKTAPPKLIDLAALSARLSSKGFKAKEVLDVYQKMYEAQIVSYPRTEDKVITPEQFNDLLPKVDAIAAVVGINSSALTHRTPRSTHVKKGGAHGANRPGPNVPPSLSDLTKYGKCAPDIYQILAESYLAMLAEDYEYDSQKGHLADYPKFTGTASVPKVMGWKGIFDDDAGTNEDDNANGLGENASPFIAEGANPKPPTPTMKWLMKQLDKNDVGTGATRTSTYADVTNEKTAYPLLVEKRGKLSMSQYGEMSYILLPDTYIGDVKATEALMQEMRDIADGKLDPATGLARVRDMVTHDLAVMKKNAANLPKEVLNMAGNKTEKEKYSGTWNGKEISFNRAWGGHRFTDAECEDLLAGKEIKVLGLKAKSGKEYGVVGKLSEQEYNGHKYVGFEKTDFVSASGSKIPDEWCQHKFTDAEKDALEAGTEVFIEGCVSKKGNVFSCNVKYGKNDKGRMSIIPLFDK